MKNTGIIMSAILVLGTVACSKVEEVAAPSGNRITITASTSLTKTELQGENGKVFWEPGDKISLFQGKVGGELATGITEPSATAKFTGTIDGVNIDGESFDVAVWGVYPYRENNSSDGTKVTLTTPAQQLAKAGSFAKDSHVLVGKSNTPTMSFYAVTGGIRFSVTRSDIISVSFKGAKDEALAGRVEVSFSADNLPVINKVTNPQAIISVSAPEGQTLEPGKYYYISALPAELKEGFEMTFNTADKRAVLSSPTAVTIHRDIYGTINNADSGLDFVERTWTNPTVLDVKAGTLAMEINPATGAPVIALVRNDDGSKGPLLVYNGLESAPITVSENLNQYVALGIAENGKAYAFTQNTVSKKGEIYTSSDLAAWSQENVSIDQTNNYVCNTIGTLGNEAFMMTCNNANVSGGIQRRNINVTAFNGTAWSTGNVLAGRPVKNTYYPVIRTMNGVMYTFVTNVGEGLSLYKYDGKEWKELKTLAVADEEFKSFGFGVYEPQDMAIAPDGQIWFGLGTTNPMGAAVLKYNVEEQTFAQIGDLFPLTNSISARSARIGVSPVEGGPIYLVFRDNNQCLMVSTLDDDTWEWKTPEKLTTVAAGDINIRFNAQGKPYIICTTGDHVEVFSTIK